MPPPFPSKHDDGAVNRDDVNGDGHADVVVNGPYREPKTGGRRYNRFAALAAQGGPEPGKAFRFAEPHATAGPPISSEPTEYDWSTHFVVVSGGRIPAVGGGMALRLRPERVLALATAEGEVPQFRDAVAVRDSKKQGGPVLTVPPALSSH
ncbi:DUF397 domain-containing protein [Streptomyces sp. 2A115]